MSDRDRSPSISSSSSGEDEFDRIVKQNLPAPQSRKSSAASASTAKPQRPTKKAATSAPRKPSKTPAPRATGNSRADPDYEQQHARTQRRTSRAQIKAAANERNKPRPVVPDDSDDSIDELAMEVTTPRAQSVEDVSSDEDDDVEPIAKPGARTSATPKPTSSDTTPKDLRLLDVSGHGLNTTAAEEISRAGLPTPQVTPKRVMGSTNKTSDAPRPRHTSLPYTPRDRPAAVASSARPSTAAGGRAGASDFESIRRGTVNYESNNSDYTHRESINTGSSYCDSINSEREPREVAPKPMPNTIDGYKYGDSTDTDKDYTKYPQNKKEPKLDLDRTAEAMLSHIIRLASLPGEWIKFLDLEDYKIASGHDVVDEVLQSDVKDIFKQLMRDEVSTSMMFEINTDRVKRSNPIPAHRVLEPCHQLRSLFEQLHKMTFVSKASECNSLWKNIIDKAPYLFERRRLLDQPRHWSFVVLLVNTCASQSTLCHALRSVNATHEWVYWEQMMYLLGKLCREIEEYKHLTAAEVMAIWDHLQKRLLKAYEKKEASATDVGGTGGTQKRKSPGHSGPDEEAGKKRRRSRHS